MRQLDLSLFLPSLEGGGAERVFVQLANTFADQGLRIDFVLAKAAGPYTRELSPQVRVVDLDCPGVILAMPRLRRYLRKERPAAVMSGLDHANLALLLAASMSRTGVRCVISQRSVASAVYRSRRSLRGVVLPLLIRGLYRFADCVIANSQAVATDLSRTLRVPANKVTVIYNPLDLDWIEAQSRESLRHPWFQADIPLIVGIGSLGKLKDFGTLIRAFSIARSTHSCRLVILGEGACRAELESLVSELNLTSSVHMPGFVNNPFPWLRKAAVFVSSSLTEGCPNALMQALASGIPVVSTDCEGGSAEILENGRWGRLVPVGNDRAMAEAIVATLEDDRGLDGRERARQFGLKKVAGEYLDILFPHSRSAADGVRS